MDCDHGLFPKRVDVNQVPRVGGSSRSALVVLDFHKQEQERDQLADRVDNSISGSKGPLGFMMHRFQVVVRDANELRSMELIAEKRDNEVPAFDLGSVAIVSVTDLGGYLNPSQNGFNTSEAAVYCGCSRKALWQWMGDVFPDLKPAGNAQYPKWMLDRLLEVRAGLAKERGEVPPRRKAA